MSRVTVTYVEWEDEYLPGLIVFNREIRTASGRLKRVGSRVSGGHFEYHSRRFGRVTVLVHCERGEHTLQFQLDVFNGRKQIIQRIFFTQELDAGKMPRRLAIAPL